MLLLCIVFGLAVSFVHYATLGMLAKNEALHLNRILCNAFMLEVGGDGAGAYEEAVRKSLVTREIEDGGRIWYLYARHGGEGDIGFQFEGMGFWDTIRGVAVLSPDLERITNIRFLEQKETPGLGARIEEKWFTDQFRGIRIAWQEPVDKRVIVGPSPDPKAGNRVDAITGASQTSQALMNLLNSELDKFRDIFEIFRKSVDNS